MFNSPGFLFQRVARAVAAAITEFLFTADPDTGFSNPSANTIQIITGGTEAWRITSGQELRGPPAAAAVSAGIARIIRGGPGGTTSGVGGDISLISGTPVVGKAGTVFITAQNSAGGNFDGGDITVFAGTASGTGIGGQVYMQAGFGGASNGYGGSFTFQAGTGVNLTGGAFLATAGACSGTGNGGSFQFTSGSGGTTAGNSGNMLLRTGQVTSGTPGSITFNIGITTDVLKISGASKHTNHMGTAPTITAGGGTTPSIVGKDEIFIVTIGTGGVATSFEVTFANNFTNPPGAIAQSDTDVIALKSVALVNKVTVTSAVPFTAGSNVTVICRGYE